MHPLQRLREPFSRLFRTGTNADMDPRQAKRIMLANQIAFSLACICLLHVYIDRALGAPLLAWFNIALAAGYGGIFLLSRANRTWAARFGLVLFAAGHIMLYVLALGKDIGMHTFFLSACWAPLMLFGWEERKSLVAGVLLNSLLLIASELGGSSQGLLYNLSPAMVASQHADNMITTLIIQILIAAYFLFGNHRAETALARAVEAAKSADQAKSRFLANMSHEIRTPLNGVLGITHLLLKSGLPLDKQEMAQTIQSSSLDLMTILNEILDLSKIEAGKMELERRPFDLGQSLVAVLKPFEYEAKRKGISLELDMGPEVSTWVEGDSTRFKQVLRNLIGNAMKFTSAGGVTLRVHAGALPGYLDFEIEDTGPGIPEAARGRIFQSFSQADESTTRKFGGTGLGLAICKQIVELMGGAIGFRSRAEGTGTIFHFSAAFPVAPRGVAVAGEAEADRQDGAGRESSKARVAKLRLLIVDDHPTNRKVLAGMLEEYGPQMDMAGSGQEALEACARRAYDLVFMDCHMPAMDGLECTRRLKALAPREGAPTPRVVGVTADVMSGSRERCLAAGMDEVLSKPILEDELDRILVKFLPSAAEHPYPKPGASDHPAAEGAWVDAGRLRAMQRTMQRRKTGRWDEMLATFRAEVESQLKAARQSLEQGDRTAAGEALHAIKGLCLTMGLMRMGEACRSLEQSVAEERATMAPEWAAAIRDMEVSLEASLQEMQRLTTGAEGTCPA